MQRQGYMPILSGASQDYSLGMLGAERKILNRGELLEEMDRRRSLFLFVTMSVAVLGFLVTTLEVEMLWENSNVPTIGMQLLKLLGSFLTLGLFYSLLRYYSILFEMRECSGSTVAGASYIQAFVLSGLLAPFLVDTVVCLIHPLPFVNYTVTIWARGHYYFYSSDSFIIVFMLCRIYVFYPRFLAEMSGMLNEKTRLIGLLNHVHVNVEFVNRHLLNSSIFVLVFTFLVVLLTLSYAMVIFERPLGSDTNLGNYENAMWVLVITMTTVGYGDTYPKSPCGRGVAVMAAFFSVILVALCVNATTQRLALTRDEQKTLDFLQDIERKTERKHLAAKVIQRGLEAYRTLKKDSISAPDPLKPGKKRITAYPRLCFAAQGFNKLRTEGQSISTDVPLMMAESSVQVRRIEEKVNSIEAQVSEMHNIIKVLAGGGARTTSTRF